jgi:hypothetical protein
MATAWLASWKAAQVMGESLVSTGLQPPGAGLRALNAPVGFLRARTASCRRKATQPTYQQLFDDLVGAQPDRWRHGKTERLGGLEVQDHLKFCRQLNG